MKKLLVLALGMVFLLGAGGRLLAQPEATGYTLSDIYYYLTEGTEATWGNHSLEPQSGVPGQDIAGFSQSMEDIYYYMAEAYGQCNVTYDMLAPQFWEGYYFFCTDSNYWGVREGTKGLWYKIYGPDGTKDVVKIGNMYVASWVEESGCANNGQAPWEEAYSWGRNLDWLGKSDWQLPKKEDLLTICVEKFDMGSWQSGGHWAAEEGPSNNAFSVHDSPCKIYCDTASVPHYVRAVRYVD